MITRRKFMGSLGIAFLLSPTLPALAGNTSAENLSTPFLNHGSRVRQAPFGGSVSLAISNYNRVSPYIANAGLLHAGGLEEAQALGFELVIDLRGSNEEGVKAEQKRAEAIGIAYLNIPIISQTLNWDLVDIYTTAVDNAKHYPILIHCVSSNRSGALWALYRARKGIPAIIAIEEGRAAGLAGAEGVVRKMLDM